MFFFLRGFILACLVFTPASFSAQSLFGKLFTEISQFNKKNRTKFTETFDNFHTVQKNAFYRSKQLSEEKLAFYLEKYGIKTLINLRGDDQKEWWLKEKAVAEKNGVAFYSIAMSAVRLTKKEHLTTLLTIYENAPRPMLVHCIGGADRTGEASALWVLDQQGKTKEEALVQLSIKYGHRKYKNSAKDFLIQIWEGRAWALNQYDHTHYPSYLH